MTKFQQVLLLNSDESENSDFDKRIGKNYQAELPLLRKCNPENYYSSTNKECETMIWDPDLITQSDENLIRLLTDIKLSHNFSEEMTLGLIKLFKGNLSEFRSNLSNFIPIKDSWNKSERAKLFISTILLKKNFKVIKKLFPSKSASRLILAYYLFKKNTSVLHELQCTHKSCSVQKVQHFQSFLTKFEAKVFRKSINNLLVSENLQLSLQCPQEYPNDFYDFLQEMKLSRHLYCGERVLKRVKNRKSKSVPSEHSSYECRQNHKHWMKTFYKVYGYKEFSSCKVSQDLIESIDQEIIQSNRMIRSMEITKKSDRLMSEFQKYKYSFERNSVLEEEKNLQFSDNVQYFD